MRDYIFTAAAFKKNTLWTQVMKAKGQESLGKVSVWTETNISPPWMSSLSLLCVFVCTCYIVRTFLEEAFKGPVEGWDLVIK